jgi:hypothetical protein
VPTLFSKELPPSRLVSYKFEITIKRVSQFTLMHALWMSQDFLATKRLDKTYALLGITRDGSTLAPLPDYRKSPEGVLTDLTQSMIKIGILQDLIALRNSYNSSK